MTERAQEIFGKFNQETDRLLEAERVFNGNTPITSSSYVAFPSSRVTPYEAALLAQLDELQERIGCANA